MDTKSWAIKKLLSGRFLLTVVTAGIFAYSVYTKVLSPQAIKDLIAVVVMFYFLKKEDQEK